MLWGFFNSYIGLNLGKGTGDDVDVIDVAGCAIFTLRVLTWFDNDSFDALYLAFCWANVQEFNSFHHLDATYASVLL